ncbi:class I SAM-dependent methyltransferase [Pseudodesulfovibrio piezophilus]|nr:class I SAM-dependent methyltransferase [Pseudodesulfovibrio piezophilus]
MTAEKRQVYEYWNETVCCSTHATSDPLSREYFEEIEHYKYCNEPELHAFAQFSRYRGKKVLEVGVGAGTDFLQWVRCGAEAHGVDLTPAAIAHTTTRLDAYGLKAASLGVADCEHLPFDDGTFDLVYSWGVIHHTPDTGAALSELIRTVRPGGEIKVMIYNRHSPVALYRWWKMAALKGKPWKSLNWVMDHHMESKGSKAYTEAEARAMFESRGTTLESITKYLTCYDRRTPLTKPMSLLMGPENIGWFMGIHARKPEKN